MPERLEDGEWRYESAEDFVHSLHSPGKYGGSYWRPLNGTFYSLAFYGPREVPSFVVDTYGSEIPRRRLWVSKRTDDTWFETQAERDRELVQFLNRVIPSWPCDSKDPRRTRKDIDGRDKVTIYARNARNALQEPSNSLLLREPVLRVPCRRATPVLPGASEGVPKNEASSRASRARAARGRAT